MLAGRRNIRSYVMSRDDVIHEYGIHIVEEGPVDPALATDMGEYLFLARFPTWEDVISFYDRVLEERKPD